MLTDRVERPVEGGRGGRGVHFTLEHHSFMLECPNHLVLVTGTRGRVYKGESEQENKWVGGETAVKETLSGGVVEGVGGATFTPAPTHIALGVSPRCSSAGPARSRRGM